ncbi:MAG: dihydropteroate synthase [Anaerolineae bacterium]
MREPTVQTILRGKGTTVTIGGGGPTVLIGERINPTGKKRLAAALQEGDLSLVAQEAAAQVQAGADVIDVNVGAAGVDEVALLPRAVRTVVDVVDVPISIDTANHDALAAALEELRRAAPEAKPLVNSVNGEERSLGRVLPLVREYGAAVIALCMGDRGIPQDAEGRVAVARAILERATGLGIPKEDVLVDCLALTVGADHRAGAVTLQAIEQVNRELRVNQTLGASNVSFGMPERDLLTGTLLAMAVAAGVTCPIVDAEKVRPYLLAADLLLGVDEYGMRYIRGFRQRRQTG